MSQRYGRDLHVIRSNHQAELFEVAAYAGEVIGRCVVERQADIWAQERIDDGTILGRLSAPQATVP